MATSFWHHPASLHRLRPDICPSTVVPLNCALSQRGARAQSVPVLRFCSQGSRDASCAKVSRFRSRPPCTRSPKSVGNFAEDLGAGQRYRGGATNANLAKNQQFILTMTTIHFLTFSSSIVQHVVIKLRCRRDQKKKKNARQQESRKSFYFLGFVGKLAHSEAAD